MILVFRLCRVAEPRHCRETPLRGTNQWGGASQLILHRCFARYWLNIQHCCTVLDKINNISPHEHELLSGWEPERWHWELYMQDVGCPSPPLSGGGIHVKQLLFLNISTLTEPAAVTKQTAYALAITFVGVGRCASNTPSRKMKLEREGCRWSNMTDDFES